MIKAIFGFILLIHTATFSQTENSSKTFDSVYYDIAVNITPTNPTRALHLADSLYNYATTDKQKIRSLMLAANVYDKKEQRKEGIEYALKALQLAKDSKDYSFEARIYGFMSTQYRGLGFSDKGREYILKGLEVSSKIEDKVQVTKYQAMANHELADYAMDNDEYEKAIEYMNLAILGYQKEEDPRFKVFQLGNAEELLGRCYMALGENEKALEQFLKANILINEAESGNTIWASMIYQGLGDTYLQKEQLDSAEVYLKKAFQISEESEHGSLKELVYGSMTKYYKEIGKLDSSAIYASKYSEISKNNNYKKNQMVNNEFNRVLSDTQQKADNTPIYIIISFVVGIGIILTTYYFRRRKTKKSISEEVNGETNNVPKMVISLSTQEELLKKLKKFESSEAFLDKNMSFSVLVGYLNTNAKYLNQILKNSKETDFNTYINTLRIEYIVEKLNSDPEYLNYKISYLADISGFSSHSNFSANFKRVIGFSPSEFIESLNQSA